MGTNARFALIPQVGIERVSEDQFCITFGEDACALFCHMVGDENFFHNPEIQADACVPGAFLIAGLSGAISQWCPGWMLVSSSELIFASPVVIGGSIQATFTTERDGARIKRIGVVVSGQGDKNILKPTSVMLMKKVK
jgi:hypothetical protein